jgi:dihydrofolate synthase/folylpolyglutamate synthase
VEQAPEVARVLERAAAPTTLAWVQPLARAPLPGSHQRSNAALALAAVRHFDGEAGPEALEGVRWPARLESVAAGPGEWVFDVAHNLDGIEAIAEHLGRPGDRGQARPDAIVFGCMADKDVQAMLGALGRLGSSVWWVPPPGEGAMSAPTDARGLVARAFDGPDDPDLGAACERVLAGGGRVLVCGSHFLVGRLRAMALGITAARVDPSDLSDPLLRK